MKHNAEMFTNKIRRLFSVRDKRNVMLRRNIMFSALLKAVSLGTSLLIVPITIHYLNTEVYGVWMTMSSILYWFSFFDIGLGNGMRNYLTEAISTNNYKNARSIIITTFTLLFGIAAVMGIVVAILLCAVDLCAVFNTQMLSNSELRNIMIIACTFSLMLFVVKNVGLIFVAMQKYALNDLLAVSGNVIALVIIYVLTKTTEGSLLNVVGVFTIAPVLVFALAALPLFFKHKELRPSLNDFDCRFANKVVGKGFGFFLIQITSCIVIFGCANVFIAQFCGPTGVTVYNIAYKYFNVLAIAYAVILAPMWSAYTDAYVKGDVWWIKRNFNKTIKLWLLSVAGGLVMLACSGWFYHLWVGSSVTVPVATSACVLAYICCFNFNCCVTYLLNGFNKIRVQIYTSFVFTALFVTSIYIVGGRWGIDGVVLCMAVSYALMALIHYYQCRLLINQKAKGIWNK